MATYVDDERLEKLVQLAKDADLCGVLQLFKQHSDIDVDDVDSKGQTALIECLLRTDNIQKRFQIACVLLAKGADPDAPDNDAKSARDNAHPAYRQVGGELNIMQEFPSTADIEDGQIYQPNNEIQILLDKSVEELAEFFNRPKVTSIAFSKPASPTNSLKPSLPTAAASTSAKPTGPASSTNGHTSPAPLPQKSAPATNDMQAQQSQGNGNHSAGQDALMKDVMNISSSSSQAASRPSTPLDIEMEDSKEGVKGLGVQMPKDRKAHDSPLMRAHRVVSARQLIPPTSAQSAFANGYDMRDDSIPYGKAKAEPVSPPRRHHGFVSGSTSRIPSGSTPTGPRHGMGSEERKPIPALQEDVKPLPKESPRFSETNGRRSRSRSVDSRRYSRSPPQRSYWEREERGRQRSRSRDRRSERHDHSTRRSLSPPPRRYRSSRSRSPAPRRRRSASRDSYGAAPSRRRSRSRARSRSQTRHASDTRERRRDDSRRSSRQLEEPVQRAKSPRGRSPQSVRSSPEAFGPPSPPARAYGKFWDESMSDEMTKYGLSFPKIVEEVCKSGDHPLLNSNDMQTQWAKVRPSYPPCWSSMVKAVATIVGRFVVLTDSRDILVKICHCMREVIMSDSTGYADVFLAKMLSIDTKAAFVKRMVKTVASAGLLNDSELSRLEAKADLSTKPSVLTGQTADPASTALLRRPEVIVQGAAFPYDKPVCDETQALIKPDPPLENPHPREKLPRPPADTDYRYIHQMANGPCYVPPDRKWNWHTAMCLKVEPDSSNPHGHIKCTRNKKGCSGCHSFIEQEFQARRVKELPFPPLDWNKRLTPEEIEKRRKQDAEMDARDAAITAAAIARSNEPPAAIASRSSPRQSSAVPSPPGSRENSVRPRASTSRLSVAAGTPQPMDLDEPGPPADIQELGFTQTDTRMLERLHDRSVPQVGIKLPAILLSQQEASAALARTQKYPTYDSEAEEQEYRQYLRMCSTGDQAFMLGIYSAVQRHHTKVLKYAGQAHFS